MLNNMKNALPYYYDHGYYAYRHRATKPPKETPGQTSSGRNAGGKKSSKGATGRRDIPQK